VVPGGLSGEAIMLAEEQGDAFPDLAREGERIPVTEGGTVTAEEVVSEEKREENQA